MDLIEFNKNVLESITWSNLKDAKKIFNKMIKDYIIDDYELIEKIDDTKYNGPISFFYVWYKNVEPVAEVEIKTKAN
jgi:hypothetical protein